MHILQHNQVDHWANLINTLFLDSIDLLTYSPLLYISIIGIVRAHIGYRILFNVNTDEEIKYMIVKEFTNTMMFPLILVQYITVLITIIRITTITYPTLYNLITDQDEFYQW